MKNAISSEKLESYFSITGKALQLAQNAFDHSREVEAADFWDMASRYFNDAFYFLNNKEDATLAFAALNYAHGWLDAGARNGLFRVTDSTLFTVDGV